MWRLLRAGIVICLLAVVVQVEVLEVSFMVV